MADLHLNIIMSAMGGMGVMSAVQGIVGALTGGGGLVGALGAVGVATAAAGVGLGVEAVRASADFQQAMLSNVAHAGLATDQINGVSQAILNMAPIVGRAPTDLAEAMYPILSAFSGITNQSAKSALALSTLKLSFETVAGTTVDRTSVANAAVGTFNALGLSTNNAAVNAQRMTRLFDIMDKTVQLGNMQWDQYKNVISKLAVSIQGTSVTFNEASSALATMTNEGFSAQRAQTYLANMFTTTVIKTDALAKHAHKLGIAFNESKYGPMTLAEKIAYLNQITDGNKQKLLALMGNNSTALKAFNALSIGIGGYKSNLDALNHSQGALATSFQVASQGFNFQAQQMQAAFKVVLITIGNVLLPVLSKLAQQITPLIMAFAHWLQTSGVLKTGLVAVGNAISGFIGFVQNMVSIGAAVVGFFQKNQWAVGLLMVAIGALGGVLALFAASAVADMILSMMEMGLSILTTAGEAVTGAVTMTTTFSTMAGMISASMAEVAMSTLAALGPFLLVGAAIAVVVVGVILVIKHWGAISAWLKQAWANTLSWMEEAFHKVVGVIQNVMGWFEKWKTPILAVTGVITAFFLPALIKVGVQAGVQAAKVTGQFIASLAQTGTAAAVNGAKTGATFVVSMAKAGVAAVVNGAKITGQFVASMIKSGAQAVISGAKITGQFIASVVKAGLAGWQAAGKLALLIGQFIAAGARAVWAGVQIAAKFVASLVQAGIQAVIAGAKMVASLVPAIISVATQAVIAAATAIPAMVVGFIAWAGAALAAAAATIAATWPILLIIIGIALLIVGIILLVKHWGAVTAFLKHAWQAVATWLEGAFHHVAAFISSIWGGIKAFFMHVITAVITFIKAHWQLILSIIGGPIVAIALLIVTHFTQIKAFIASVWTHIIGFLKAAWATIIQVVKIAALVLLAIIIGPIGLIIIYIITHFNQVKAFLITVWNTIIGWIAARWNYLKIMAEMYFMMIYLTIQIKIRQVERFFYGIWNGIIGWITARWNYLKSMAEIYFLMIYLTIQERILQVRRFITQIWDAVVGIFQSAHQRLLSAVQSIWNGIVSFVSSWPGQALQWGKDLIQNLINGITSMAGGVGKAVGGIAKTIASFIHFSKPDTGPLKDIDKWMPDLGDLLSTTLKAQTPKLHAAVSATVMPLTAFASQPLTALAASPRAISPAGLPGSSPAQASGSPIIIHVSTLAGSRSEVRRLTDLISQELGSRARGQHPGLAQGGIFG